MPIERAGLADALADRLAGRFAKDESGGAIGRQVVDARITNFSKKDRKVMLSIKALEMAEEKEAMQQYGSADSGATLGDILGAALKKAGEKK